ncbi:MAG: glycosyltransferase family 9 protein [Spirochaetes bacterium]|nr:glycosyltransferase family 9 protein [Spirochaetota bacterium]
MPLKERLKKLKEIKILIIRLKPVGDTVLISAVFRNLKKMFPQCVIDIVVYPSAREAIGANPYINKVLVLKRNNLSKLAFYFKLLFSTYHITIDYINNPTSSAITLFAKAGVRIGKDISRNFFYNYRFKLNKILYSAQKSLYPLKFLGLRNFNDFMPEFYVIDKDRKQAQDILKKAGIKKNDRMVGIFVSAKYPVRQYRAEHFARLASMIKKDFSSTRVLFLFGKDDRESILKIKKKLQPGKYFILISDGISIGVMAGIISHLNYFLTNDTGPKHLATALKIPTLTVFGATTEKSWNPPDTGRYATIRKRLNCAPCNKLECRLEGQTLRCVNDLAPEDIYKKLKVLLKKYLCR